jgi:hypothetical protein
MNLQGLIAPMEPDKFFGCFWERAALHIPRNNPDYFPFLGADLALEEIIFLSCPQWGDVSVARAGTKPADCPYTDRPPKLRNISAAFADKYTIVVNDMQKKDMAVAQLCRGIESDFFCRANVNLYLTNYDSQGLDAHYDDDDVFILQLRGTKTWRIYNEKVDLPLSNSSYVKLDCSAVPYESYVLRPGDVLYVPRGFIHDANTADVISLHLTVSLATFRWSSFFQELVRAIAESEVDVRRAIPHHVLRNYGDFAQVPQLGMMRELLGNPVHINKALARIQDGVLSDAQRLPRVRLSDGGEHLRIDPNTRVKVSDDQIYCLEFSDGSCVLKAVEVHIRFPSNLRTLVLFICTTTEFSASEMPSDAAMEERVRIVQRLLEDGFLTKVS